MNGLQETETALITKYRGIYSNSMGLGRILLPEFSYMRKLQFNYWTLEEAWKPSKKEYAAFLELLFNDLFTIHALSKARNLISSVEEDLKKIEFRKKSNEKWGYSTSMFDFVYHINYSLIRIISGYDKLLHLIEITEKQTNKSKTFSKRVNNLIENTKSAELKKYLQGLKKPAELVKARYGIEHYFEERINIFDLTKKLKGKKDFLDFFNELNKENYKLYNFILFYLGIKIEKKLDDEFYKPTEKAQKSWNKIMMLDEKKK